MGTNGRLCPRYQWFFGRDLHGGGGVIYMINKLNNFTEKSFESYTSPDDLSFRAKNILFGYNGKGKSSIAKIEAGSTPNPTIDTVKKIADALGVSLDDLMK